MDQQVAIEDWKRVAGVLGVSALKGDAWTEDIGPANPARNPGARAGGEAHVVGVGDQALADESSISPNEMVRKQKLKAMLG